MECQSRATVKLSAPFEQHRILCELGASAVQESSTAQELLLLVFSKKFGDCVSVVLIGKDEDDEALMLEVTNNESRVDVRWTTFMMEEAVTFTVEMEEESNERKFYLCTKHDGIFKYLCISSDSTLHLSATCPDMLSFEIAQLIEPEVESGLEPQPEAIHRQEEVENEPLSTGAPIVESINDAPVYHTGFLMKKGDDILGNWKKRHFVAFNRDENFRIDYFDKEGGVKKGSIDMTNLEAALSRPEDEAFGIVLVPYVRKDSDCSNSSKRSSSRIYRLKAESAESQAKWLSVFVRATDELNPRLNDEAICQPVVKDSVVSNVSPSSLPINNLTDASSRSRSRTRSSSAGSLTIDIPKPSDVSNMLMTCEFLDGPLGMTLKRRASGVVYVATVEGNTQASSHNITAGDIVWRIGSKDVGNTVVNKEGWGELVAYIKKTPRPIEMVFQKLPSCDDDNNTSNVNVDENVVGREECLSSKSAYSLVDYPTENASQKRPSSPSTPLSLVSVPSMSSGSVSESDYSRCNSGTTLQSMDTVDTGSSAVNVPDLNAIENKEVTVKEAFDNDGDVERCIVEELAKRLVFKNTPAESAPSGKGWRSTLLGGGKKDDRNKSDIKPSFQLVQNGRRVVFEGQLLLLAKKALWQVKIPKMLYLFNDILIIAVPSASSVAGDIKYNVEQILDLATCKVNCRLNQSHEMVDGHIDAEKQCLLWELLCPVGNGPGSMVFLCSSLSEQQKWVQLMSHSICEHMAALNGSTALGVGWRHQYLLGTMHAAVLQRDQALVVNLLESFAEGKIEEEMLEGPDEDGYTPLHYACILRLTGIIRLLQESSADVTAQDRRGLTPIHWAALQLDAKALEMLCMNVMNVDVEDIKGRTPLYLACVEGRGADGKRDSSALLECVKMLLTYGADPNRAHDSGLSILHHVAADWEYAVVELLLEGLDIPSTTGQRRTVANIHSFDEREGSTALHHVCGASSLHQSIGEGHMILVDSTNVGVSDDSESSTTVSGAGLRTLLVLLEHGALPNMTNFYGHTPLSILAKSTLPDIYQSLASEDSHLDRWATSYDSAIVMLLSNGARMSVVNPITNTVSSDIPPHWANPAVQNAINEGTAVWTKKDQLDGDIADVRIKCYEYRKCSNAIDSSDLRQLASRSSHFATNSYAGGATPCLLCLTPFTMFRRQHHCRLCDALCCDECSRKRVVVDKSPVRVCDTCYTLSKQRVNVVMTEQFFAGKGAMREDLNKLELLKGTKNPDENSNEKTSSTLGSTKATLEDTRLQLQERGEKLANLGDKSEKLANASSEFANMAKLLKEQNKSSSWW